MTGYPPKCPQNGNRIFHLGAFDRIPDCWPGDRVVWPNGTTHTLAPDGTTWRKLVHSAKTKAA